MADPIQGMLAEGHRSNRMCLRTLIVLRWIAIVGQLIAITVAQRYFNLSLELGLCYVAIGASIIANLVAIFVYPENKRLSEGEVFILLLFDISQLAYLLYLTGGLDNPFALLILVPVTISATALQDRSTLVLGAIAIAMISFVALFHVPLRTEQGFIMRMPDGFVVGSWIAITIGIVFEAICARRVASEIHSISQVLLATQMALAREQKLTDLGGVATAAAHELGTPLATIKLASAELMKELRDWPELYKDAALIRDQADRCRDILRSMGSAGKDDLHLRHAPLGTVIREAAEPHSERGKEVIIDIAPGAGTDSGQPAIAQRPEIIHGLRNLVQNAVGFAKSTVWIDAVWTESTIGIRIIDDGRGFSPYLLGHIGDPFVRTRCASEDRTQRPEYEGMGLGLFIAKTLLERSGAELTFDNGRDPLTAPRKDPVPRFGAIVEVVWPRHLISPSAEMQSRGLGENRPIEV